MEFSKIFQELSSWSNMVNLGAKLTQNDVLASLWFIYPTWDLIDPSRSLLIDNFGVFEFSVGGWVG